jgi:carbamoyl-phosphate synthase large subunit
MNNILITSAGRRVSLVRFFQKELKKIYPDAKVFTTDAKPEYAAACQVSDDSFAMRRVTEKEYVQELLNLCLTQGIKLVIPTIDTELLVLAQSRTLFSNHGITLLVSNYDCVQIFRDKRLTHRFFQDYRINHAKEYTKTDYQLPLYIKPYDGSRSVDNYVIMSQEQLTDYHFSNDKLMFLEYLDHKGHTEFTIDLYYDKASVLKCVVPRQRIEVRDGEVNKAITKAPFFMEELTQKLHSIPGFRGCITLQVFVNQQSQSIYGIEINPRFGGGYPLSYLAGANFPQWLIQEYLTTYDEIPFFNDWEQNLMMLRYDDEVLVHNVNSL